MMPGSDKLCVQWNDFNYNVKAAFGELRGSNEFSDVTLACEDGSQVEAHKMILASSSPLFMDILRRSKHTRPLIYMRGTSSEDLTAIMDFVYFGEANVSSENLDTFLALAEELKLKGLVGKQENEQIDIIDPFSEMIASQDRQKPKQIHKKDETNLTEHESQKYDNGISPKMQVALLKETASADLQHLDEKVKSMMTRSKDNLDSQGQKATVCTQCGKEGQKKVIRDHIEANHITGVSHSCDQCGHNTSTRAALLRHTKSKHQ